MKTSLRTIIPALGLAVALPALAAEAGTAASTEKSDSKARREVRVLSAGGETGSGQTRLFRVAGKSGEMESVTFLGVETAPVSPTLVAQLGLSEGNGLVVNHVANGSPAAGVLKQHDILLKLDDQILIEQRQLAVLIRGHKEGDEVTLTYLRAGKQATAKVKLAKHDAPKLSTIPLPPGPHGVTGNMFYSTRPGASGGAVSIAGPNGFEFQLENGDVVGDREEVNRVLALIDAANAPGQRRIEFSRTTGPGDRNISVTVNTGNSRILSDDDEGSLELVIKDGQKELVAKDKAGKQVFAGPVNTPEERKAVPAEVRARLEKLEAMKQFSFTTDDDFKGAQTRIIRPLGQGISLPAPARPLPARPSLSF